MPTIETTTGIPLVCFLNTIYEYVSSNAFILEKTANKELETGKEVFLPWTKPLWFERVNTNESPSKNKINEYSRKTFRYTQAKDYP